MQTLKNDLFLYPPMNTDSMKKSRAKYNLTHKKERAQHSHDIHQQKKAQIHQQYYTNIACSYCGVTNKRIIYHHLDPTTKQRDPITAFHRNHLEELSNCIPLCYSCHQKLHHQKK